MKVIASTSGMARATTNPARMPRLTKLTMRTMATASKSARTKPETASSTICGWSETRCTLTPSGRSPRTRFMCSFSLSPNSSRLAFWRMPMARPMAGWRVEAEERLRRIGVPAAHLGDVAEAEEAVIGAQVHRADGVLGVELPGHLDAHAIRPRLEHAGRRDGVLLLERGDDRVLIDAEGGELGGGELEEDDLVLRPDEIHPPRVGDGEHAAADVLDVVAQLPVGETVAGEGVDVAEHVAEVVVEERPDDPARERPLDVLDQVAHAEPAARHVRARGRCPSAGRRWSSTPGWRRSWCSRACRAPRASSRCGR